MNDGGSLSFGRHVAGMVLPFAQGRGRLAA